MRDPRKNSAFESGMRGREKPKVQESHGGTKVNDNAGGESRQEAGKTIGEPGGVDHTDSAYSSGMRGMERPKQKSAAAGANKEVRGSEVAGNRQEPDTHVGDPAGHNDAERGARKGVHDSHLHATAKEAYELGIPGNSTEEAADYQPGGEGIIGEEDDTHINVRIPKASLKKKNPGLQTS